MPLLAFCRFELLPIAVVLLHFVRVPRKCVWDPTCCHTHARLYTNIDTPSERECPIPLLSMQWGMGGLVGPGNAGVGGAQSLKFTGSRLRSK